MSAKKSMDDASNSRSSDSQRDYGPYYTGDTGSSIYQLSSRSRTTGETLETQFRDRNRLTDNSISNDLSLSTRESIDDESGINSRDRRKGPSDQHAGGTESPAHRANPRRKATEKASRNHSRSRHRYAESSPSRNNVASTDESSSTGNTAEDDSEMHSASRRRTSEISHSTEASIPLSSTGSSSVFFAAPSSS